MAFSAFPEQKAGVALLQCSMERGRLGHGYLFAGADLLVLEQLGRTLAKTLNCLQPIRGAGGAPIDCCDACLNCRKIDSGNHADVLWVRPESKTRVIVIDQVRDLAREINLKPCEAEYKVAFVVAADRLNVQAANAFLKTLEEPPPKSVLVLLSTEPRRLLETIISRCLRVSFGAEGARQLPEDEREWLAEFVRAAAAPNKSLLARYRLLDRIVKRFGAVKATVEQQFTDRSPLQKYAEVDKDLREKWEAELAAAVEAEYRHRRGNLLLVIQQWLRDVWVHAVTRATGLPNPDRALLNFPELEETATVAGRLTTESAEQNLRQLEILQRQLATNVQEALALEVSLLKLQL